MTKRLTEWMLETSKTTLIGGEYGGNVDKILSAISYAIACDLYNDDIKTPDWMLKKWERNGAWVADETADAPDAWIYFGKSGD